MSDDENEEGEEVPYSIKYEGDAEAKTHVGIDGKALATFPNGDTFSGEYKGFKREGKGEYSFKKAKAKYVGDYVEGKKAGSGVMTYPDGSKYTGQWSDNERHGLGTYVFSNGDRYCGSWTKGVRSGDGTYVYKESQTQLSGTFIDGQCVDGKWEYFDGTNFACQWHSGYINTYGGQKID